MCYHPNVLFYKENSVMRKDGQIGLQRISIIFSNSQDFKGYEYYLNENERLKKQNTYGERYGYKLIPCGKCLQCLKQQRLMWATRIELESKEYKNNYFITLTYNEENVKIPNKMVNTKTGEIYENDGTWKGTLVKNDLQQFLRSTRLWCDREYNHRGIKFYAAGEYGDLGNRPHYHIILMNTPELEINYIGSNEKGNYHTNKRLEQIWHKGYITVEPVCWDTISYTAGYCEKKLFGDVKEEFHAMQGQIPIFSTMSRRPGIARNYYEEHKDDIYLCDEIINSKGQSIKPPSYFDRLMDAGEHDFMQNLKKQRDENANNKLKLKMSQTDKTLKEQLEIEERTAKEKDKKYRRKYKII